MVRLYSFANNQQKDKETALMPALLNADEVFAIAVQIEDNAAAYYRRAAELQSDSASAETLKRLAAMEEDHKATFAAYRKEASAAGRSEPLSGDGGLFLAAIASGYPVEGSPSKADELTGNESMKEIVGAAVELEKKGILFYLGIKDAIDDASDIAKIEKIINDEKAHVVTLLDELKKLD